MDYIVLTQGSRMSDIRGVSKSNMVYGMNHMYYNNIEKIENLISGAQPEK